ncbi:MAG: class IV adenylate cyclase [Sedimentisphaerales bacterium]|nr:class IV adenylate cyclase [Sedimentisphaerales bacterium]
MFIEIEAKLKVDSLAEVENKLRQLDAEFVAEQDQSDIHFDDLSANLSGSDKCLRLRRQVVGETIRLFLTYKGAKEKSNYKKRQEIEFEVGDAESAEKLLAALGYERRLSVDKKRRLWKFGGCEVALDKLKELGEFVEIEGPDDEKISEVQKSLGLGNLPHIKKSYAALIMEKSKSGKD